MIIDTLYKGRVITKGETLANDFKTMEKNILNNIEKKKTIYLTISNGFKEAFEKKKQLKNIT